MFALWLLLLAASAQEDNCSSCFDFSVDWASGSTLTSLPTHGFGVRKVESFVYPADGRTYAYADIVNYTCPSWTKDPESCPPGQYYYPDSYSTEVGVFSSSDGRTAWSYHGIVIPRGAAGGWDSGGIASPGAAAAADGTVLVGYAAENSPSGGRNRGIGLARAQHPLGPFVKDPVPIASPETVCGGTGRCDDVIMQSRPDGSVHLYHSVKGSNIAPGSGIRHRMTLDGGVTWSNSSMVLSSSLQPGHEPAETIAGAFFPRLLGGHGGMVLITDGCSGAGCLHAYVSRTAGSMVDFVASDTPVIDKHPAISASKANGSWANNQIAFFADESGDVASVGYTLWGSNPVKSRRAPAFGMTMTIFALRNVTDSSVRVM